MTIRENTIVFRKDSGWSGTSFRVEKVSGTTAILRNLVNYQRRDVPINELEVRYQVGPFDRGDVVRVREEFRGIYNEADGLNDLTVIFQSVSGRVPICTVENNNGVTFNIVNERIELYRPAKAFKKGDKVVVDLDLAAKYSDDGTVSEWDKSGKVLELTEDSGSRYVKTTSNVKEVNGWHNRNVPTRWLKPYEEPAKRVVGETIRVEDVKEGDTISSEYEMNGLKVKVSGVVGRVVNYGNGVSYFYTENGGVIKSLEATLTLLEEAPAPVDENLQRLLDAKVGTIVCGTYSGEYWKKTDEDEWHRLNTGTDGTSEEVFDSLFRVKYGVLEFFERVEDAD